MIRSKIDKVAIDPFAVSSLRETSNFIFHLLSDETMGNLDRLEITLFTGRIEY